MKKPPAERFDVTGKKIISYNWIILLNTTSTWLVLELDLYENDQLHHFTIQTKNITKKKNSQKLLQILPLSMQHAPQHHKHYFLFFILSMRLLFTLPCACVLVLSPPRSHHCSVVVIVSIHSQALFLDSLRLLRVFVLELYGNLLCCCLLVIDPLAMTMIFGLALINDTLSLRTCALPSKQSTDWFLQ